jgi:hypothetical protein
MNIMHHAEYLVTAGDTWRKSRVNLGIGKILS